MVHTCTSRDYTVEEITQVGRKGRSHGHKYDGADFDESMAQGGHDVNKNDADLRQRLTKPELARGLRQKDGRRRRLDIFTSLKIRGGHMARLKF
ncbi:hypothetical protein POX_g08751 [Penicillium oxalicum]|uniref:hypothetical protein n=1 Tax=Penicillium oxalicum TaxID=69781 RepID=UPI0020B840D6|nr:hypothetical protein POX_g08751 [Penicillium oxalicum]KAI2786367.1 hypothetical protein POX_g08751 [Penicillium oxalicum]